MQHPDFVVVGIHIVDILGRPVTEIPPGQGIAFLEEVRMTVAGTAAGTAVDLARLGQRVASVGLVGQDTMGDWLIDRMGKEGVDVSSVRQTPDGPTSATILPIRPNGERPALHLIGANALLGPQHLDWEMIERARFLHIGGTSLLAGLDGEPTAEILRRAKGLGVTTSLDLLRMPGVDVEKVFGPCYPYLDYFLPNDEDALALSGQSDIPSAARWFLDQGVGAVAITLGGDGALLSRPGFDNVHLRAPVVDVVDTTGCGDAFSAGFLTGLADGLDVVEALRLGIATGSIVATGLGSDAGLTSRAVLKPLLEQIVL